MPAIEKPTHILYFAYGSDMNPRQMAERCAKPELMAIARLPDHALGFFSHTKIWDGAQATVVPAEGKDVWGIVYRLTVADMERLDFHQDARIDGTGPYFNYPTEVLNGPRKLYSVLIFKKDILGEHLIPSRPYLERIIAGAEARGLPKDYIETLKAFPSREPNYEVPKREIFDRSIIRMACTDCG
jgi:hypothetical protein